MRQASLVEPDQKPGGPRWTRNPAG